MTAAAPAAPAKPGRWTRGRLAGYGTALVLLVLAVVLAAFRVGEQAGRLSDWQTLVLGVRRA